MKINYIILFLITLSSYMVGQDFKFSSTPITMEDGLCDYNVNCIIQDQKGFMWFGTRYGLNCYDGYRFTNYFAEDSTTENSISHNYIRALCESKDGLIWIGTLGGGLNVYNQVTEKFVHFDFCISEYLTPESPILNKMLPENISSIASIKQGEIWVGTRKGIYLLKYSIDNVVRINSLKRYFKHDNNSETICDNLVYNLNFDSKGRLWIGTNGGGLSRFSPEEEKFTNFITGNGPAELPVGDVLSTFEDSKGRIWIGTWEGGLCYYDEKRNEIKRYSHSNKQTSLIGNNVKAIIEDDYNNLWIGAMYHGLDMLSLESVQNDKPVFIHHWKKDGKDNLIDNNIILAVVKSRDGVIWVSTIGRGLRKIVIKEINYDTITTESKPDGLSGNNVTAICTDKFNRIWAGTYGHGLNVLSKENGKLKPVNVLTKENGIQNTLASNYISSIMRDDKNLIWVGTKNGLNRIEIIDENRCNVEQLNLSDIKTNDCGINVIYKDIEGVIWLGTNGHGLYKVNNNKMKITRYTKYKNINGVNDSLSNLNINCIFSFESYIKGAGKELWVGTDVGLNRIVFYNDQPKLIKYYHAKKETVLLDNKISNITKTGNIIWVTSLNGISRFDLITDTFFEEIISLEDEIKSIIPDAKNNLWISCVSGIIKFNSISKIQKFVFKDNSQSQKKYNQNSYYLDTDGLLILGSKEGLFYFYPDKVESKFEPNVVMTQLKINNNIVKPGKWIDGRTILEKSIKETKHIELEHSDNVISIEFAVLSFDNNTPLNIAYNLESFSSDWLYTSGERSFMNVSNLNEGDYVLKVKVDNRNGGWGKEKELLIITVLPPFWRTWWAYLIYFVFIVSAFYLFWRIIIFRMKLLEEIRYEKFQREKDKELNQHRIDFFTNISHELRTPLTLITGPVELLMKELKGNPDSGKKLSLVYDNAVKLLHLINQLLDFRKIEMGKETLKASCNDVVGLSKRIFTVFEHNAAAKNIAYEFNSPSEKIDLWIEPDKFEKILANLLSNAFKYTPENGNIVLNVNWRNIYDDKYEELNVTYGDLPKDNYVEIEVLDNGIGIDEDDIQNVFERFYMGRNSTNSSMRSGIGLSLVKELVLLHRGQIGLVSVKGKGSRFIVRCPLGKSHLQPEEIAENGCQELDTNYQVNISSISGSSGKNCVLVVEDNAELREFITGVLAKEHSVIVAENGKTGLEKALEFLPDLIVSDVMMPVMNGLEFCKEVKSNIQTSHIPFILLTAKTSLENSIEGLEVGADDYITKPFSPDILLLRIRNRFETINKLRERFSHDIYLSHDKIVSNSEDEKFLSRLTDYVATNLENEEVTINEIYKEFDMSQSSFYRKLKHLTNHSPVEFVNSYRMKYSARLLLSKNYSVKEIAFKSGFSDPNYFSARFKKYFKMTPSEYLSRNEEKTTLN